MSKTNKIRLTFLCIIILAILAGLIVYPKLPDNFPGGSFWNKFKPNLGLDLQGGAHLVYQADFSAIEVADEKSSLQGVRDVIERRINAFGVAEPLVQLSGQNRIIIELAGVFDIQEAISRIGATPLLEFKELSEKEPSEEEIIEINKYNEEQKTKAEEILQKLKTGEDFAQLAQEFSEDPGSKDSAGIIDFTSQEMLAEEYAEVLFNKLSPGQLNDEIVETQFGYHIIKKLEERINEGGIREVKSQHILLMIQPLDIQSEWKNTQLSGQQLKSSNVLYRDTTGEIQVGLEFNDEGNDLFAEITERNIGKPLGIFLDGEPITIPTVNEKITGGNAVITGSFNSIEAKELSQRLNAGALPVPINLISQQTVGASLGKISLEKSLFAGLIGLILLALFMIIYYRLLGIFAVLALGIYALISLSIFELIPVTLTLSGIAGFILSIGMAVDANVLIFERTKEELRARQVLLPAIEEGFNRAWPSIRDSNFSSLITCFILYSFGASMVKGFALTLGIGILVSMFSALVITKNFLRLSAKEKIEKHPWLFGIKK